MVDGRLKKDNKQASKQVSEWWIERLKKRIVSD